jgi:hypothetical protein
VAAVGFVANPYAGKDVRRLVSLASPVSDAAKVATLRRAMVGAVEAGARVLVATDTHHLAARAAEGLGGCARVEHVDVDLAGGSVDTRRVTAALHDAGAGAVIALGGDGTCRDVVSGWRDVPLVALSTGTNNVFPRPVEGTVAGVAAALVATGTVPAARATDRLAVLDVVRPDGSDDLALVDVALLDGRFTGSRAVWDVGALRAVVCAIAEPDAVGLSAVAAGVVPAPRGSGWGAVVELGPGGAPRRAAIAPGRFETVHVAASRTLRPGEAVVLAGPGVVAFDGERDLVLRPHEHVTVRLALDGPRVIDVPRTLAAAVAGAGGERTSP